MSTKTLRIICDGLNAEPFSRNLTLVKIDNQTPDKLLQILSDVVCYILSLPEMIDIRSENPDETAVRILNALKIFRYPPPHDVDEIQKWRLDILEGNKLVIYPVLEWIFENFERLKERVYLAQYLTKIDVPAEAQTPEVMRLIKTVNEKMEEFKTIHSRIVDERGDFMRAEDVLNDLKTMNEEKEQLLRKIERSRKKISKIANLDDHLAMAEKLHSEKEHQQELQLHCEEQRNALMHVEQRLTRLKKTHNQLELERDNTDPEMLITKLKREIEINNYVLNQKLINNIATQKTNIEAMQKIVSLGNVTPDTIDHLKSKILQLNSEIASITEQQNKKDEANENNLVVYRHQAMNIQRKKANLVDSLYSTKRELDNIEEILAVKKREISEKTGKEEIVSSVQYKTYIKKLRNKNIFYKRKKTELEHFKAEVQILERTIELLTERFEEIKNKSKNEGREVIETLDDFSDDESQKQLQTTKPKTNDVNELKQMNEQLNNEINEKNKNIQELNDKINQFYQTHKENNEQFYISQQDFEELQAQIENEKNQINKSIEDSTVKLKKKKEELKTNLKSLQKLEWFRDKLRAGENPKNAIKLLEDEKNTHLNEINELNNLLEKINQDNNGPNQMVMWSSLKEIFNSKINLHKHKNNSVEETIGNGVFY